jgi:PAS domain S-box-containing protein
MTKAVEGRSALRGLGAKPRDPRTANNKTPPNTLGDANNLSREAIEALHPAVYMTDVEGRITFYNEAAAALWGRRPEVGESKFCGSWKLYWPDGTPLPHDKCPMAMALRQKRPIRGMEAIAERPDGTRVPFLPYPTPLFDATGRLTGAINMLVEISDHTRAETRLAERNGQLDLAGKIARIGKFTYDHATQKLQLSEGCAAIYGLPEGTPEISREDWRTLVLPDDLRRLDAVTRCALANRETELVLEFRILRHGEVRWIESRVLILYDEAGRAVRRLGAQVDVTDRKRAEQALVERNVLLALAGRAARVGTFAYDTDEEMLQISENYAAIHGLPKETAKIARSDWLAGVHPQDVQRVELPRSEAFREQRNEYSAEFRIIRPGGEVRWVEIRCFVTYDANRHPKRVVGVSTDVTDRKQAELALGDRNTQLALAGKVALVGSYAYDVDADEMQVSEGYAAIHGLPDGTADTTRSAWRMRVHPEDVGQIHQLRSRAYFEGRREHNFDYRIVCPDRGVRWIESRSLISYNSDGSPQRVIGINIDVTDRKQTEARLSDALAAGQVVAFEWDALTGRSQRSDNAGRVIGFVGDGRFLKHVHPDDRGNFRTRISGLSPGNPSYALTFRFVHPDGHQVWLEETARGEFDGKGRLSRIKGLTRDITERKRAEEARRILNAELDHRVKNTLATVAAVISHTRQGSKSVAAFATALEGRIRSMAATHELLSSRHWRELSLIELIQRELAPYATRNNIEINGPTVLLKPEAGQAMAMVLHELATNAAKYGAFSTNKGRVSVRWDLWLNRDPHSNLVLEWQEVDGPRVNAHGKSSYGTSTIRDLIPYEFGGMVDLVFAPEGLRCRLELPANWLSNEGPASIVSHPSTAAGNP